MPALLTLSVESSSPIAVEVSPDSDVQPASRASRAGQTVATQITDFASGLAPALQPLIEALKSTGPREIVFEFGIAIAADASFYVAKGSAEANFTVSLKWENG